MGGINLWCFFTGIPSSGGPSGKQTGLMWSNLWNSTLSVRRSREKSKATVFLLSSKSGWSNALFDGE